MSIRTKEDAIAVPIGGRICQRSVVGGHVWVGVLHLPDNFTPTEGVAYAISQRNGRLFINTEPASQPLDSYQEWHGIKNLLESPIWPKSMDAQTLPVRFIGAFPDDNVWGLYGASHYALDDQTPSHVWCDVSPSGRIEPIEAPFDAAGQAISQLLTSHAVWPAKSAELYTIPQLSTAVRPHFYTYHKLLAEAGRNPELMKGLRDKIASDPNLRNISMGSIDPLYCEYLAELDDCGQLKIDAPQHIDQLRSKEDAVLSLVKSLENPSRPSRRNGP